ncbi:hypothetical protein C1645_832271, partial [Glomus cerebriforme]
YVEEDIDIWKEDTSSYLEEEKEDTLPYIEKGIYTILPYLKEYIMKKERVKYLAIKDASSYSSYLIDEEVNEFKLYNITIQPYDNLHINCEAIKWYLKSTERRDVLSCCNLKLCQKMMKDKNQAFEWYLKFANNGNSLAQYYLGNCFENSLGTTKNDEQAFKCY